MRIFKLFLFFLGFSLFSLSLFSIDSPPFYKSQIAFNDFETNPYLTQEMRETFRPYLLPYTHPLKERLDKIFFNQRAVASEEAFLSAGFIILKKKPRSFIRVAIHPNFPQHLFKVYFDSQKRQKKNKPGWWWLAQRCKGAEQIRYVILKNKMRYFQVPNKWLYPFPAEPLPSLENCFIRQPVLLIEENMQLVSKADNKEGWKKLSHAKLKEFYHIIRNAGGSSYRPDNVCLSRNGKFSFIDTEYPNHKPDYTVIGNYLDPKARHYWEKLTGSKKK